MYEIFTETRKRRCLMRISMIYSLILIGGFQLLFASNSRGQSLEEIIVTIKPADKNLEHLLKDIELQTHLTFAYLPSDVRKYNNIGLQPGKQSVKSALDKALVGTELRYRYVENSIIIFPGRDVDIRKTPVLTPGERSNDISMSPSSRPAGREVVQALSITTPLKIFERRLVRNISGRVVDSEGEPLIGVNIQVKDSSKGTATDFDGNFTLEDIDENAVLVISYIGYQTQEIVVGGKLDIEIVMVSDSQLLDEVVVVGYGSQRKANLTGAVSTVSVPQMEKRTVAQTSLALQGLVPGVTVTQRSGKPGGDGGIISVRGKTTIGNNNTLVLIDGVESNINSIDPESIESISVLKDAASAAIYGNRAANGVILITTKRAEEGKAFITYSNYFAKGMPTNVPKYVGAIDFMKYISIAKRAVGMTPEYSEEYIREYEKGVEQNDPNYPDVDWFDATATNNGLMTNHFITISQGTSRIKSLTQIGYLSQNGITENTNFKRYSLRSNNDYQVAPKLQLKSDISIFYTGAKEPTKLGSGYNFVGRIPANQAAYLADGRYGPGWQGVNPVAYYKDGGIITNNSPSGILNLTGEYKPFDDLEIQGQYALNYWESHNTNWNKRVQLYLNDGTPDPQTQSKSTLTENTNRSLRNLLVGRVTYRKSFKDIHNVKLMGGYQQETFLNRWHSGVREEFPFPNYPVLNAGGQENQKSSGSASDYSLQAVFGRINYDFQGKYLVEGNLRYDGSSRFAEGYRWGVFPSFSVGWRISEEVFWDDLRNRIDNFKIRASWGQLGNQNTLSGYYPAQSTVNIGTNYIFDKNIASGAAITRMANSLISWETTTMTNIAIEFNLFRKLDFVAEYYHRKTDDILLNLNIPLIIGLSAPDQNAGKLENKGWEIGATFNDRIGEFNFSGMFNLSDVKNKILDLRGVDETGLIVNREGYPMSSIYGYEADGYIVPEDYDSEGNYLGPTQIGDFGPGDIKYKDLNGDGVINTSDLTIIGNTIPRYTFGLNLYGEYKGIDLNLLFQGVGKADGYVWGHSIGSFFEGGSMPEIGKDYWTVDNRNAQFPRLAFNNSNNQQNSSFWIKDASYVRLKNLQVGYTLPKNLISRISVSDLRFYLSTDNVFTISKFWKYFDVEAPVLSGYGNFYPIMRTTTIGLDLKF